MENKICFAVPTYPMHYLYARNFLKSFKHYGIDKQADLYFIFTNNAERDGFLPCDSIVLPKSLRIFKNRGIINIKKFYALMQLKNRYEYIIVLDDECEILENINLMDICKNYFSEKRLYGNILMNTSWDIMGMVGKNCKSFFDEEDQEKLICPLYLWFNQLPIYETAMLDDFFKNTKLDKKLAQLTYYDFDYYIYMMYLILKSGFIVEDIGIIADCAISELQSFSRFEIITSAYKKEKLYLATDYAMHRLELNSAFIVIHRDRNDKVQKKKGKINTTINAIYVYNKVRVLIS